MRKGGHVPATPRRIRAGFVLAGSLLVIGLLGTSGCTGIEPAGAAGAAGNDLVSEVADRLAGAGGQSWTATYRLAGGETARITRSQRPARIAYAFPSGNLIRTPDALTKCATAGAETVCTATDPHGAPDELPATAGLVTPDTVLALLNAAAIDPDLAVQTRETTIAERTASCLRLGGVDHVPAPDFDVCVTVEGAIAGFTGTVAGTPVEMVLTDYQARAGDHDFTMPPGARFVDRRAD
ncbi:hypothetical protein [Actinoplanes campanulatus]|uniref:hypothetical protein n=1 Tax=Actinoplanes campanulatus TaxID=113559 RepID=UPI0019544325|nr:hypothetical protein [Actinoplanes capillaceus]